jgi:hypothetical protein
MTSERLRKRIVHGKRFVYGNPAGIDYLVSWGEGAAGLRYCAFIDEQALTTMAADAGLTCTETFFSDGREGNLNLYGVFTAR